MTGGPAQDRDDILAIGRLAKAHGLKGEIVIRLTTNRSERLEPGVELSTGDRALVVESARPKGSDFVVKFVGIDGRDDVEALQGAEVFAAPIDDPDELWVHELIGSSVTDQEGVDRGTVESVEANPASDLLVLDSGSLVPVRFVESFNGERIIVDVPAGLFDI